VPLRKFDQLQVETKLETVQFTPSRPQTPRPEIPTENIVLRNAQPVVIDINSREARVRSAQFVARETNLEVTGSFP